MKNIILILKFSRNYLIVKIFVVIFWMGYWRVKKKKKRVHIRIEWRAKRCVEHCRLRWTHWRQLNHYEALERFSLFYFNMQRIVVNMLTRGISPASFIYAIFLHVLCWNIVASSHFYIYLLFIFILGIPHFYISHV